MQVGITSSGACSARALAFPSSTSSAASGARPDPVLSSPELTAALQQLGCLNDALQVCVCLANLGGLDQLVHFTSDCACFSVSHTSHIRSQAATNDVVVGYQEHTARLEKHKADAAIERSVLKMFYLDPQKLEVGVESC